MNDKIYSIAFLKDIQNVKKGDIFQSNNEEQLVSLVEMILKSFEYSDISMLQFSFSDCVIHKHFKDKENNEIFSLKITDKEVNDCE